VSVPADRVGLNHTAISFDGVISIPRVALADMQIVPAGSRAGPGCGPFRVVNQRETTTRRRDEWNS